MASWPSCSGVDVFEMVIARSLSLMASLLQMNQRRSLCSAQLNSPRFEMRTEITSRRALYSRTFGFSRRDPQLAALTHNLPAIGRVWRSRAACRVVAREGTRTRTRRFSVLQ